MLWLFFYQRCIMRSIFIEYRGFTRMKLYGHLSMKKHLRKGVFSVFNLPYHIREKNHCSHLYMISEND